MVSTRSTPESSARAGIQSVEVAASILESMARAPGPVQLKDLADSVGMAPAKAHRYLVSLSRSGLVEQEASSGRYGIGPLALTLGLAALGQIDVVRLASEALPDLRDRIGETSVLAIWGDRGPTVIRFEESRHPVTINVRVGSDVPVLLTALGKALAAYPPFDGIDELVDAERLELVHGGAAEWTPAHVNRALAEVRARGVARVDGDLLPGVAALAAPVRDRQGRAAAAIGAIGRAAAFDSDWDGPVATALKEVAARLSARLGFTG